jgi:hypothetical protein
MRLTVRIKDPRWDARDRYAAGVVKEYTDYTGDVVPRFPWLDDNWFVMTTGDKDAPFRILHKDNILGGWLDNTSRSTEELRFVSIPGKSGKQYTVTLSDDNTRFSCNCTAYGYRRKCSHVDEVMAAA